MAKWPGNACEGRYEVFRLRLEWLYCGQDVTCSLAKVTAEESWMETERGVKSALMNTSTRTNSVPGPRTFLGRTYLSTADIVISKYSSGIILCDCSNLACLWSHVRRDIALTHDVEVDQRNISIQMLVLCENFQRRLWHHEIGKVERATS